MLTYDAILIRQVYVDEERSESFFCCAWSLAQWCKDRRPLLAIAGQLGIIRVLDLQRHRVSRTLMGHGNGTQFTCFTGAKVQILTPEVLHARQWCSVYWYKSTNTDT
jgi:hypothetical protein